MATVIEVAEYDVSWSGRAGDARRELQNALPGVFVEIEHIGSTAVPGLAAKPVIDLMAAVDDLAEVTAIGPVLGDLDYHLVETGMRDRLLYARRGDGRRTHHLHVVTVDSWPTRNERLLRDHLREHPDDARAYGELKVTLAADSVDVDAYTRAKTALIQRLIDRARDDRGLPRVDVWED
jgi:GrpB-like predicted nucleotidyltransferase (UPF0157 family)